MSFLPINKKEMEDRGWIAPDFVFVSGDAYVDHPSFGVAILTRLLEAEGYKVCVLAQPDWKDTESFKIFGKPKYGFFISGGVIDSMVNHYTVNKVHRKKDVYSPGGSTHKRPDRAVTVYSNKIRQAYGQIPIVIGGIEASLRRFSHYDYWEDKIKHSILIDSQADLLIYGMGERTIIEVAKALEMGHGEALYNIRGTSYVLPENKLPETIKAFLMTDKSDDKNFVLLNSYESLLKDKKAYIKNFLTQSRENDPVYGRCLLEKVQYKYVIQNPPQFPLSVEEADRVYALPFERTWHPVYDKEGGIEALKEVEFSITSHRGCFGSCNFCALTYHFGRRIVKRSEASILREAKILTKSPRFKGYIHDLGGPTANFRNIACDKQVKYGVCKDRQCMFPKLCPNLKVSHREYLDILRKLRKLDKVKKVFIRSGIRFDYLMADKDDTFFNELCKYHISGQLKVAPEHFSDNVLKYMGKCPHSVYENFKEKYNRVNKKLGKKQYLVPYLMSSHPGSSMKDALKMKEMLKGDFIPEQVQDFYPTPSTLSTLMYYTEMDPFTFKKIYVAKTPQEKKAQRDLLSKKSSNHKSQNRGAKHHKG
ncbi:MAG: YgiQ family radical SAM protein [Abditibacteriota bacterium]|nr:YgiQ family radical SAM protein [Abditibacteriota bacterium]